MDQKMLFAISPQHSGTVIVMSSVWEALVGMKSTEPDTSVIFSEEILIEEKEGVSSQDVVKAPSS